MLLPWRVAIGGTACCCVWNAFIGYASVWCALAIRVQTIDCWRFRSICVTFLLLFLLFSYCRFFFVHFQIGAVYQKLEAFEQENIVSEWLMLLLFFLPHERSFYDCDDWTDSTTVQQVLGWCFFTFPKWTKLRTQHGIRRTSQQCLRSPPVGMYSTHRYITRGATTIEHMHIRM